MAFLSTLSSLQGPIVLLLVILGPSALPRIFNIILRIRQPNRPPPPPRPPLAITAKALVAVHTLYRLYALARPPFNVFTTHNLPLFTSNESLRRHLLPLISSGLSSLAPSTAGVDRSEVEQLLLKLTSLDNRLLYARLGHTPLLTCAWCSSLEDYGIAALPGIGAAYALTAVLLGVLGLRAISGPSAGERKRASRGWACWVLALAAMADLGARWAWDLRVVDGDTIQLDAYIRTLRTVALLLLPIIYLLVPLPSSSATLPLAALLPGLTNATSTIRLTSLARAAAAREPATRAQVDRIAAEEEGLREAARRDEHVRAAMATAGLSEQGVRESARRWVDEGWGGLVRVGPSPTLQPDGPGPDVHAGG